MPSHDDRQKSKKTCSYFLKGTCAFGKNCSKRHEADGNESSTSITKRVSSKAQPKQRQTTSSKKVVRRSPTPPDFGAVESSLAAAPIPSRPVSPAQSVQSQAPCMFYAMGMTCQQGEKCEFYHQGASKPQAADIDTSPEPSPENVCEQFLKGKCTRGSKCRLLHVSHSESPQPPAREKVVPLDQVTSTAPRNIKAPSPIQKHVPKTYRPTSPFGYQGVVPETPRQQTQPSLPAESESDGETEDGRYDDADEVDKANQIADSILKGSGRSEEMYFSGQSPENSNGSSDYLNQTARVYPVVTEAPKPIPYVTVVVPHWSQFADPKADGSTPFCKRLAQNQCMLREACPFRHSLTIDEYTLLFKDLQPNLWTVSLTDGQPEPSAYIPSTALASPPPPLPSTAPAPALVKRSGSGGLLKKSCAFYPLGKCNNGNKCPYAHDGTPPNSSSQGNSSPSVLPASESSWDANRPKKICRNFEADGYCKFGDACHFGHPQEGSGGGDGNGQWNQVEEEEVDNGWGATGGGEWEADPGVEEVKTKDDKDSGWGSSNNHDGGDRNGSLSRSDWSRDRPPRSRACFNFSAGRCHRGDSCKFSHDQGGGGDGSGQEYSGSGGEWSESFSRKRQLCYQFQRGECTRGSRCRFSHGEPEEIAQQGEEDNGWGSSAVYTAANHVEEEDTAGGDGWGVEENNAKWETEENGEGEEAQTDVEVEAMDNDDSWAEQPNVEPDAWSDVLSVVDSEVGRIQKPCKAFGQGACDRGDSCRYLHTLPDDQWQYHKDLSKPVRSEAPVEKEEEEQASPMGLQVPEEPEPVVEEVEDEVEDELEDIPEVDLERFMFHCTVLFNNRCSPERVMTAADSRKVLLSNLPADSSIPEVRTLVESIGAVKDMVIVGERVDSVSMAVDFEKPADALVAVKRLNDQPFGSRAIFARLDSRTPVFARSPLHSPILVASWPGPVLTAWSFYETVTLAKLAAGKLDKVTLHDRQVNAFFDRPGKKGPYAVRLTGLAPSTTKSDIDALCVDPAPTLTTLGEPTYKESPEERVREELGRFGHIENFRISAQEDGTFKTIAYVTMQSYSVADAAATALRDWKPDFLGKQSLKVQHVYLAGYKVSPQVFECIIDRLNLLRDKYKGKCKIADFDDGYFHTVEIRASIIESTTFSEANAELNSLVDGLVIMDEEGQRVWDPYFELSNSTKVIEKINNPASDVPCFVQPDPRIKCLRVYGSTDGQERGKSIILKTLKKVREQYHEIILERPKIGALLDKGLMTLRESLGANKVTFDIVESRLIIRGAQEDLEKAKLVVSVLASSPPPAPLPESMGTRSTRSTSTLCPLCERVPLSPVTLTCRHAYCKTCLQFALNSTAKRESTPFFRCVFKETKRAFGEGDGGDITAVPNQRRACDALLSYFVVRDNLPTVTEVDYLKAAFLNYVQAGSAADGDSNGRSFFYCPTPECQAIYRSGEEGIVIRCAMCSSDICPRCCSRIHDGSLCEEIAVS